MNDDFAALDASLREFVVQEDHVTLILLASQADLAVPAKLFEAQGRQSQENVFILAVAACPTAAEWMNAVMRLLQNQVQAAQAIRAEQKLPPWPALPLLCLDPRQRPAARLRAAAEYCTQVVPEPERIVWVLLPHTCDDAAGYAEVVRSLCTAQPWMDRHRFVVWDDREAPQLVPQLRAAKAEILYIELDFSAPKQLDRLVRVASDPAYPPDVRMDACFQLAAVDFAYKRYAAALEKYGVSFSYYEGKDKTRQALCLLGTGDVALETDHPELARQRYQSGLAIAVAEKIPAVMLPLAMGAGRACLALQRFAEAEGYFDLASALAGKLMNAYAKADAIELRGAAERAQGGAKKLGKAIESWETCRRLCERFAYEDRWTSVLQHELALYEQAAMEPKAREVRARLAGGFRRSAEQTAAEDAKAKAVVP